MPTGIWSSWLRSGSAHWDLELAVRSGRAYCDLEVAVEVRQCPLRSATRGGGPAVPTGIRTTKRRRRVRRRRRRRRRVLIKSSNPPSAGGEYFFNDILLLYIYNKKNHNNLCQIKKYLQFGYIISQFFLIINKLLLN